MPQTTSQPSAVKSLQEQIDDLKQQLGALQQKINEHHTVLESIKQKFAGSSKVEPVGTGTAKP